MRYPYDSLRSRTSLVGRALYRFAGRLFVIAAFFWCVVWMSSTTTKAHVAQGNEEGAKRYYRNLSKTIGFSTPEKIFETKLDDVANYFGYRGLTGSDLQNLATPLLMGVTLPGGVAVQRDEILVTRFFAPKVMNIKTPEATRKLGWRKLVRLRARPGSAAETHHISSGIILFNFFTAPGVTPFSADNESVNTQVMLVTNLSNVPAPNTEGPATLYWLDYDRLSKGGLLSFALEASFDANELQDGKETQPYFVPDGCIACHGNNSRRSMVNYLDTDHWFDRLDNDFPKLKTQNLPLLVDAGTNDFNTLEYKAALNIVRQFNAEADAQAQKAQPRHDEVLAAGKWLEVHASNDGHVLPVDRAIGEDPRWSAANTNDVKVLDILNQNCFRCHGTIKFSVFNKQAVIERRANIKARLQADAPIGIRMPPDRELPDDVRVFLHDNLP